MTLARRPIPVTIPRPGSRAGPRLGAERLQPTVCFDVQMTAFGDFQLEIYLAGLQGVLPSFPPKIGRAHV